MTDATAQMQNFSRHFGGPGDAARLSRSASLLAPAIAALREAKAGGDAGKAAAALAALRAGLGEEDIDWALLTLYLQLWLMDIEVAELYTAARVRFDVGDPPADFWYQRIDKSGSHDFFQDGIYLTETIPAVSDGLYHNSEIYNSTQTKQQPRSVIANLFSVDDPADISNLLYDLFLNTPFVPRHGLEMTARVRIDNVSGGSRGWGFWNTSVLPPLMQVAWFIQFNGQGSSGVTPFYDNGFYAITQNGLAGYSAIKLCDLDEDWHDYRIWIGDGAVHYYIDGACVASVTDPLAIPSTPMALHYWVDNSLFGWDAATKEIVHLPQTTYGPRSNIMKTLRIRNLP